MNLHSFLPQINGSPDCVKSLLLSQFLRLLKSSDVKALSHVAYWIGDTMCELRDDLKSDANPKQVPEYFAFIESLVVAARIDNLVSIQSWKRLTNKQIYIQHSKSFPLCKIEVDSGRCYKAVWQRINLPILRSEDRQVVYLLFYKLVLF